MDRVRLHGSSLATDSVGVAGSPASFVNNAVSVEGGSCLKCASHEEIRLAVERPRLSEPPAYLDILGRFAGSALAPFPRARF